MLNTAGSTSGNGVKMLTSDSRAFRRRVKDWARSERRLGRGVGSMGLFRSGLRRGVDRVRWLAR